MIDKLINIIFGLLILFSLINYINLFLINKKNKKVDNSAKLSGCEIATKLLEANDFNNLYVVETKNLLEERYDVSRRVIRLSTAVFNNTYINDLVISSIESMYAIEDKNNKFIHFRNLVLPTTNIITYLSIAIIILSSLFRDFNFLKMGLAILGIIIIYNLAFLKEEKNIVALAQSKLLELNLISEEEKENIEYTYKAFSYRFVSQPFILIEKLIKMLIKQ